MEKLNYKIGIVEYDFNAVIEEWIREDLRDEATEIISKMLTWNNLESTHIILEWIIYLERKMGNQICMHFDYMKYKLVKAGIVPLLGQFGTPFTDEFKGHLNDDSYFDYKQFFKDL